MTDHPLVIDRCPECIGIRARCSRANVAEFHVATERAPDDWGSQAYPIAMPLQHNAEYAEISNRL
jgi:hypothetical protein